MTICVTLSHLFVTLSHLFVTLSLSKGDWLAMTVNKWALSLFFLVIPAKAGIQFLFIFMDTGTRALQGMRRYDGGGGGAGGSFVTLSLSKGDIVDSSVMV